MRPVIVAALPSGDPSSLVWAEAGLRAGRAGADLIAIRTFEPTTSAASALGLWVELQRGIEEPRGSFDIDLVFARGDLAAELVRVASGEATDLIVVGAEVWPADELPDRVRYLVKRTRCPVMVVRHSPTSGVLVGGVDGTSSPFVAEALAQEQTQRLRAFTFLVHCVPPGHARSAPPAVRLDQLVSRFHLRGLGVTVREEPGPGLVAHASDLRAELVVVGASRGDTSPAPRLGRVASHVVRHASSSVLVVPPPMMPPWPSRIRRSRPQA